MIKYAKRGIRKTPIFARQSIFLDSEMISDFYLYKQSPLKLIQ